MPTRPSLRSQRTPVRRLSTFRLAAGLALATGLALVPQSAQADRDERSATFRVEVRDADGSQLSLAMPTGWLNGFLAGTDIDLDCDGSDDRGVAAMMRALEREGEGAVWNGTDDDGDPLHGRRKVGQLVLESRDEDGETARIEMPWPLAHCLLGGIGPAGGLEQALTRGDLEFRIDVRDGDGSEVRIAWER